MSAKESVTRAYAAHIDKIADLLHRTDLLRHHAVAYPLSQAPDARPFFTARAEMALHLCDPDHVSASLKRELGRAVRTEIAHLIATQDTEAMDILVDWITVDEPAAHEPAVTRFEESLLAALVSATLRALRALPVCPVGKASA